MLGRLAVPRTLEMKRKPNTNNLWPLDPHPGSPWIFYPQIIHGKCLALTSIATCLNHFLLIEVCSVDVLVACLRISTTFIWAFVRETLLWDYFGGTDKIALVTCSQNVNISTSFWWFPRHMRYGNKAVCTCRLVYLNLLGIGSASA